MTKKTLRFGRGFKVIMGNRRVQAAQMVIARYAEGGPKNRHRGADQWLFVVGGTGTAKVNGRAFALKRYSLLLIEHGERHQIKNTGWILGPSTSIHHLVTRSAAMSCVPANLEDACVRYGTPSLTNRFYPAVGAFGANR
jgi:hypothetical protein